MPASAPIRLLIVDDSALVREGLRAVLGTHGAGHRIEIVAEAGTIADGLAAALQHRPAVALLDIRLPDGSGLDACRAIRSQLPDTNVLILTSVAEDELIEQAIRAGAQGYLLKEIDPPALVRAIADAAAGRSVLSPEVTHRVMQWLRDGTSERDELAGLSTQERRVLAAIARGGTNKEVANELGLSEKTVKNYLSNVFEKLKVNRRTQAAVIYSQAVGKAPVPNGPSV